MSTDETRPIPQIPTGRKVGPAGTGPDPCADGRHRSRPVRDANDRELGYLCLGCARLVRRRGDLSLLEACALVYLKRADDGEVELGRKARRRLETILRRERRKARGEEADG